jgi:hypothetical protein
MDKEGLKRLNWAFIKMVLIPIFIDIILACLYIFSVIPKNALIISTVIILGIIGLFAGVYHSVLKEEKFKKEMAEKIVAPEDIQKCVKDWTDKIKNKVFKNYYDTYEDMYDYYHIPFIPCPRCLNEEGIDKTMKCKICDFVIPAHFQPPSLESLVEFFKEERRKRVEEERKKKEEKREEMIFQAKDKLSRIGYQFNGDKR